MPRKTVSAIKKWIKSMGFKLTKSYVVSKKSLRINYYNLGNFGIYEELELGDENSTNFDVQKYVSWNPWGEEFEAHSVNDLNEAFEDSLKYNPELA